MQIEGRGGARERQERHGLTGRCERDDDLPHANTRCTYTCLLLYIYTIKCTRTNIFINKHTDLIYRFKLYIYIYIYIYIYVCVCVYIYIYINIYIFAEDD